MQRGQINHRLTDEQYDDTSFLINKIEIGQTSNNIGFINVYDRGSLRKYENRVQTLREKIQATTIEGKLNQFEFLLDHMDGSKNEFHPDGEPGNRENHYHLKLKSNKAISLDDINSVMIVLKEIDKKSIHEDFFKNIITAISGIQIKPSTSGLFAKSSNEHIVTNDDEFDVFNMLSQHNF